MQYHLSSYLYPRHRQLSYVAAQLARPSRACSIREITGAFLLMVAISSTLLPFGSTNLRHGTGGCSGIVQRDPARIAHGALTEGWRSH